MRSGNTLADLAKKRMELLDVLGEQMWLMVVARDNVDRTIPEQSPVTISMVEDVSKLPRRAPGIELLGRKLARFLD